MTIAVVDDDPSVRQTLERFIQRNEGLQFAGAFKDAPSALLDLPAITPQVVLMDIRMPGLSGIDCARRLKRVLPATKIIMVTALDEVEAFWATVHAGADGFLTKPVRRQELTAAIQLVMDYGHPVSAGLIRKLSGRNVPSSTADCISETFSSRETEIISLAAESIGDKQIADILRISTHTVAWHHVKRTLTVAVPASRVGFAAAELEIEFAPNVRCGSRHLI